MNATSCDLGIGSDHAGYRYKQLLIDHLRGRGLTVRDFGTDSEESVDYPKYIRPVAEAVAAGECRLGIVLGGSGNGEAIVANKVRGIRCAVCWSLDSARLAKEHNNANVISLGQRLIDQAELFDIVDAWLDAKFEGGRHIRRIEEIEPAG